MEKTALYDFHKNLGAKFVSFAGYEMPIQYKDGIVKEHISTRQSAGFFDVSHMGQLFISGNKSSEQNLEKIIPLDFKEIKMNQSKYSFLINDKHSAMYTRFLGWLSFPLFGSGDRYGESVSTNILSIGISFIVSLNSPAFLKVTIPDKEI